MRLPKGGCKCLFQKGKLTGLEKHAIFTIEDRISPICQKPNFKLVWGFNRIEREGIKSVTDINAEFHWKTEPEAEKLILDAIQKVLANPFLKKLQEDLKQVTGTLLLDWTDHVLVNDADPSKLEKTGYKKLIQNVYRHPRAKLPDIVLGDCSGIALLVDSIADFLMVRGLSLPIQGAILSPYRSCLASQENNVDVFVVERRGAVGIEPSSSKKEVLELKEKWKTRPRSYNSEEDLDGAIHLAQELAQKLSQDYAACLVLECEREYWQGKNTAAALQKNRQDRLGMGWANHDHHTFRSSRLLFTKLVRLFEILGFTCRERFYAGEEAGWGAQIMENPQSKLVLFLDVDLTKDEIAIDFAHEPLPKESHLGTIGLWCALHGDSILRAGMHHLEAQFSFEELKEGLESLGIKMMPPFSNLPYLKQAFTEGEPWKVEFSRIDLLLNNGLISKQEAEQFAQKGAIGSHMENLQRKEGYKGFNQKNVSIIIKKTDPRHFIVESSPKGPSDG